MNQWLNKALLSFSVDQYYTTVRTQHAHWPIGRYAWTIHTVPKIRNKYFQKPNCSAAASFPLHSCICVYLYVPKTGAPILLQETLIVGIYITDT